MYFAATSYKIYYGMEYLTKKFFVVQTPKINLMSPQNIFEPCKLVTLLFAVSSCIFCSNSRESFFGSSQILVHLCI